MGELRCAPRGLLPGGCHPLLSRGEGAVTCRSSAPSPVPGRCVLPEVQTRPGWRGTGLIQAGSGAGRVPQLPRLVVAGFPGAAVVGQPMGGRRQGWLMLVFVLPENRGVTVRVTGSNGLSFLLPPGLGTGWRGQPGVFTQTREAAGGKVFYPVL